MPEDPYKGRFVNRLGNIQKYRLRTPTVSQNDQNPKNKFEIINRTIGLIFGKYRCLDENLLVPIRNPMFCNNKNNPLDHTFVMECCNEEDFCNVHLSPVLMKRSADVWT
ncbi:hypothetical protein HHI36_018081 [Cryptolaemus montrouzieri]|uniref:Activin types I and II receptor domain-containing protein n=1 Tax=Cryptolaemus montrouzieri TaxID=559131 RepID=A0ABD2NYW7_9CUCU